MCSLAGGRGLVFLALILVAPQIAPLGLPDIVAIDDDERDLLGVGELDGAAHGVAYRHLVAHQIVGQIRSSGLRAMNDADLTVALLSERQVDRVRLELIDLLKAVPGHGSLLASR